MDYEEIEDIAEIRKINAVLAARLTKSLSFSETRVIGYPAGHEQRKTFFSKRGGEDALWWAGWTSKGGNLINLWGHGTPGEIKTTLMIDVQFNLPGKLFNRGMGGTFLREVPSGKIILAHRGIVTLGHGRFPRDRLFDAMGPSVFDANTSRGTKEFLLIGELESKALLQEISIFSANLRAVLREITESDQGATTPATGAASAKADGRKFCVLRDYLKEFAGKRRAFKPKNVFTIF